jgi:hypothetical protein
MTCGENAKFHVCRDGRVCPLSRIERRGVELRDVEVGLRPAPCVREDSEMQEHPESKIDERSLQIFQWLRGLGTGVSDG